jgi:PmbA protein
MQGKDYILSNLDKIIKKIDAEQVELVYQYKDNQLTRFANNYIHQNVAERDGILTIKTVNGKKVCLATVNSLDDDLVKHTLKRIKEIEEFQPEDHDFISLPKPELIEGNSSYDEYTAFCEPLKRAEYVKKITDMAEKFNTISSGQCSTTFTELAVMNSLGINSYTKGTEANLLSMVMEKMEGFSNLTSYSINEINPDIVAEESVSKCVESRNPVEIEPDFYTVVLDTFGVSQLVELLCFENFDAKSYMENRSCISGKLEQKITGDLVSIYNDPTDPEGVMFNIDMEGLPRKKIELIKNGIAKNIVHNSYTAGQMGVKSTGNKVSSSSNSPYPLNITMKSGDSEIKDMISSVEKGLYITKLNYINAVDPKNTVYTGLTRGGTFLIENGKITNAVYNLRFTDSTLKMFNNISMISNKRRIGGEYSHVLTPAIKIDRFRFTGKTKTE